MPRYHSCSSDGFSHGYSRISGSSSIGSGSSNSHCESETWSTGVTEGYGYAGTPYRSSYTGNPETVERCIFQEDVLGALARLKRRSALRDAEARVWFIAVLQHLLLELLTDDVA